MCLAGQADQTFAPILTLAAGNQSIAFHGGDRRADAGLRNVRCGYDLSYSQRLALDELPDDGGVAWLEGEAAPSISALYVAIEPLEQLSQQRSER
jgi:hypothetical protein